MARENPYIELSTAFKSGNFEPLYLLYGEEKWFIDRLQKLLLAHALEPHERDFNLDILYGNETDARSALGACQAFPMMAQRRVCCPCSVFRPCWARFPSTANQTVRWLYPHLFLVFSPFAGRQDDQPTPRAIH